MLAGPTQEQVLLLSGAAAVNTHSTHLTRASNQWWKIADADQTGLDLAATATWESWVKYDTLPAEGAAYELCSKWNTVTGPQRSWLNLLITVAGAKLFQFTAQDSISNQVVARWSPSLATGTWFHFAITWDGAQSGLANQVKFYVDGVDQGAASVLQDDGVSSIRNSTNDVTVGDRGASAAVMDGALDECRIWNIVRTQSQIDANKSVALVGNESGLVALWAFDNDATDKTSNGNTLVAGNGTPTFTTDTAF